MRPDLTAPHKALIESQEYDVHWQVLVANADGSLVDLSDRVERISGSLPNPRQPIKRLEIDFLREPNDDGSISLAPLMGASTLNRKDDTVTYAPLLEIGRPVIVRAIPTAVGAARPSSGYYEFFKGRVTSVRSPLNYGNAGISCADQFHPLTLAKVQTERVYPAGTAIEDVAQAVLDDNGFNGIVLSVPIPTGAVLQQDFRVRIQRPVWQVLWSLAQSIGWVIWGRYDALGVEHLTLFEPNRNGSLVDLEFEFLRDVNDLSKDESELGNVGYLEYSDADGERQTVGPLKDQDSIDKYGGIERPFWIVEPEDSTIRTATDALGMLTAALSDLSDLDALIVAEVGAFVWGEVSVDRYKLPANDRLFDFDQTMAPFSIEFNHEIGRRHQGLITFRDRPTAGARTWKGRGGQVENPISAYSIFDVRETGGAAEGYRRFSFQRGSKVAEVWSGFLIAQTPFTGDPWATVRADMSPLPAGQNYVDVPEVPADNKGLLRLEPRLADGSIHPQVEVVEMVIDPVPPRIAGWIDARVESGVINVYAGADPTFSALPVAWEIRSGSRTGTILASGTWTSTTEARDGVGPADDSDLGGITLDHGRQQFWLIATDVAGNTERLFDAVESVREGELDNPLLWDPSFAPIEWVSTKPTDPGSRVGQMVYVFNAEDADHLTLFEWDGSAWTATEPSVGFYSYLPVIIAGAIRTEHLAANAVTAEKIAALAIEVGKHIQSSNYAAGSAGWSIDGDGDAEFNDVTIRGNLLVDIEKTLRIPYSAFRPVDHDDSYNLSNGYLDPGVVAATRKYYCALTLPKGIIIDQMDARLYRETADDVATVTLWRGDVSDTTGLSVAVAECDHSTTAAWQSVTDGPGINETVGDSIYTLEVELFANASLATHARFLWVELAYTAPSVVNGI